MIVERSMHPQWLSNAYVIAAAPGAPAAFVDSGAPLEPLLDAVSKHDLRPTHLLTTHGDHDHVDGHARLLEAFDQVRDSVMDVLMQLPHETAVYPGHTDETTIGREWEENPFVRVWRGLDPEGTEACRVGGEDATLVVWSPDYDGKGKAWVRFADGRNVIIGGSRVERG